MPLKHNLLRFNGSVTMTDTFAQCFIAIMKSLSKQMMVAWALEHKLMKLRMSGIKHHQHGFGRKP